METMITVQPWKNTVRALDIIKEFKCLGIRKVRVNLKTSYMKGHLDTLFEFLQRAAMVNEDLEWFFDIGLPGDTLRLVIQSASHYVNVLEGDIIKFYFEGSKSEEKRVNVFIRKPLNFASLCTLFHQGEKIYYGDGEIEFRILRVTVNYVEVVALNEGELWDAKAIYSDDKNIIQYDLLPDLMQYISLMPKQECNAIICSFTEDPNDIVSIRKKTSMKVIGKIETAHGLNNIDALSKVTNGIMLGRGDLFFDSINYLHFFQLQERFLNYISLNSSTNSILATGILDSMRSNRVPSRSDITDLVYLLKYHPKVLCLSSGLFYSSNLKTCVAAINQVTDLL